jgi:hypothetical protein
VQAYAVRWMPSSSTDVAGYVLSIGTSSGSYMASMQVNIPVAAASAGSGGTLTYTIQLDRSRDNYLAMRAYDGAPNFSVYSNELRVAALATSAATTTSGGSGTTTSSASSSGTMSALTTASATANSASGSDADAGGTLAAQMAAGSVSLDFDGSTEYLASSLAAPLDAAAGFSASLWAKAPAGEEGRRALLRMASAAGTSGLELSVVSGPTGRSLELRAFDTAQALDDVHETLAPIADGEWWNLSLVVDPAQGTAQLYLDGEPLASMGGSGISTALSAGSYSVTLGAGDVERAAPWLGRLGHAAIWSAALGAQEIAEISLLGHTLDLRVATGDYQAAAALAHYWRLGSDQAAVGFDYGLLPLDLDDAGGNLDVADVVGDAPESLAPASPTLAAN